MHRQLVFVLLVVAAACATGVTVDRPVVAPMPRTTSAFEAAGSIPLPQLDAAEYAGLHNLYRLSDNIVSGSEPEGEAALERLAEMGIKTILSVDGKAPDHETAAQYGMRYVHVPIRYRGMAQDELLAIAKTFREQPGPFYVHCFHGKHRGPAAAAVGRVVLDGASRGQAVAEMRQWCGTSSKYEGLYAVIAFGDLPAEAATRGYAFDFPEEHRLSGFRHAMIELPRSWDVIEDLRQRDWRANPSHPDASARNEAAKVCEIFAQAARMEEVAARPEQFRAWLAQSEQESRALAELLMQYERGDAAAGERAQVVVGRIKALCSDCHAAYRND